MGCTCSTHNFKKSEIRYHENLRNIEGLEFTTSFSRCMPINCIRFKKYFKNCHFVFVFCFLEPFHTDHAHRQKDVSETIAIRSFVGDRELLQAEREFAYCRCSWTM
jgi:hypothetical protein